MTYKVHAELNAGSTRSLSVCLSSGKVADKLMIASKYKNKLRVALASETRLGPPWGGTKDPQ